MLSERSLWNPKTSFGYLDDHHRAYGIPPWLNILHLNYGFRVRIRSVSAWVSVRSSASSAFYTPTSTQLCKLHWSEKMISMMSLLRSVCWLPTNGMAHIIDGAFACVPRKFVYSIFALFLFLFPLARLFFYFFSFLFFSFPSFVFFDEEEQKKQKSTKEEEDEPAEYISIMQLEWEWSVYIGSVPARMYTCILNGSNWK